MTRSLAESLGGHSPTEWAADFLEAAGFPASGQNLLAVVSWEYAESGAGGGMFNPLNTTQGGYAGESDFNSVGVKNYVRYRDGIAANAKVIRNGFYGRPVALFEAGTDARAICDAITASPWGTGFIALHGAPPVPVPSQEVDVVLIASPHKPGLPGRTPAAVWRSSEPNRVLLTNGASIARDVPIGAGKRSWSPPMQPGRVGVGIMASIARDGRPNGLGIVFQDDAGNTYDGPWS